MQAVLEKRPRRARRALGTQGDAVAALGQEGADRDDISLPAEEMALVKKAIADAKTVNAKVILVLNVAGPVEVEEVLDDLDAVVLTYFPGMEGGNGELCERKRYAT